MDRTNLLKFVKRQFSKKEISKLISHRNVNRRSLEKTGRTYQVVITHLWFTKHRKTSESLRVFVKSKIDHQSVECDFHIAEFVEDQ